MMIFDHTLATRVVVRVLDGAGEPVGAGMLLGPDLVATCAHVVADAARGDAHGPPPARPVRVDVPMVAPGASIAARVVRWQPIAADGSGDIAVLRLERPVPAGARMPPLRRIDQLWGHAFRVLGFPEGLADGVWATGTIRGRQATGWHQLQATLGEQPIVGGFSGSPVWDDASGAVVGMTVATDATGTTTTAYLIPIDQVLGIDPELLPCPYRGLEPFGEEHAAFFFGRDDDIAQVMGVLGRQPLVAVAGPSGAGKSSLVRAGLLPRARSGGAAVVELRPLPGQRLGPADLPPAPATGTVLLLVDQFEELAAADPAAARDLLVLLGHRLDAAPQRPDGTWPLQVVLTARSATLDDVLAPGIAARLGAGTVLVPPMDRTRLRDAIVAPAERAPGLTFEPGLVERILDDAASEPGHLPLVESLLAELWARRTGGILTVDAYQRSGGVAGVVATRAEEVLRGLAVPPEDPGLRSLFVALVGTDRDGRFVRRPLPTADVLPHLRPLADRLVAGRLLVIERPAGGVERLQLAHQALLEHWPRLRSWLAEDRTFVQWRDQAEYQRERWEATGRDDGGLLRGTALAATADWLPRRTPDVPAPLREYVDRSRARQRRTTRRLRAAIAVFAVLALAAGALAAVAVVRGSQVTDQLRIANAEVVAQAALRRLATDPVTAAALAVTAHRLDPGNASALSAMSRLATSTRSIVEVHPDISTEPVLNVSASRDSRTLMYESDAGITLLYRPPGGAAQTWRPDGVPARTDKTILSLDGSRLAVSDTGSRTILLWDAARRTGPVVVPGTPVPGTLSFSPDSTRLNWITAEPDGDHRRQWDLDAGRPVPDSLVLERIPGGRFQTMATTNPGIVAVAMTGPGGPTTVTLRSTDDGAVRATLPADAVLGYPFHLVCVAGQPRTAAVLDSATGAELRRTDLLSDCSATYLQRRRTANGDTLMEPRTSDRDRDGGVFRVTRLSDGRTYDLLIPQRTDDTEAVFETGAVVVVPDPDGSAVTAITPRGTALLVARGERDMAGLLPTVPRFTGQTADGAHLVAMEEDRTTVIDRRTRTTVASLPYAALPEHDTVGPAIGSDDVLGVAAAGNGRRVYTEFSLPALDLRHRFVLPPAVADVPDNKAGVIASRDRVAGWSGGTTALWDRGTGELLGSGRPVVREATRFNNNGQLSLRPGTDEAVLYGYGTLELWNLRTNAPVAEFDTPGEGTHNQVIFTTDGSRMATLGLDNSVTLWDVDRRAAIGQRFVLPTFGLLLGFTSDGHVLVSRPSLPGNPDLISTELWDPQTGRLEGDLSAPTALDLTSVGPTLYDDRELLLMGRDGALPARVPITVDGWQEALCRLVDRPYTRVERSLLPAGADEDRPCG